MKLNWGRAALRLWAVFSALWCIAAMAADDILSRAEAEATDVCIKSSAPAVVDAHGFKNMSEGHAQQAVALYHWEREQQDYVKACTGGAKVALIMVRAILINQGAAK